MSKNTNKSNSRFFKTDPRPLGQFAEGDIDVDGGIIRNVVMCQEGPAKGHGVHLEGEFIDALAKYDRKHFKKSGLKARFDHPGMCSGTQGTQLGKFFNFKTREVDATDEEGKAITLKQLTADLEILDSAELSPTKPGMKSWLLSMAEEAPDFIMCSIVFQFSRYYQRDDKGKKDYVWEYVEETDEDGYKSRRWKRPDESKKVFIEFGDKGRHYYTDMVEAGAATDNLFSAQFNSKQFGVQVSEFLREQPQLLEFIKNNPDKVQSYLSNAGINFQISKTETFMGKVKDFFLGKSKDSDEALKGTDAEFQKEMNESRAEFQKLQEENQQLKLAAKAKTKDEAEVEETPEETPEAKFDALSAKYDAMAEEFAAFKKKPAAEHTETATGDEEPPATKERAYQNTGINQRTVYRNTEK